MGNIHDMSQQASSLATYSADLIDRSSVLDLADQLLSDGVVIVKELLHHSEVAALRSALETALAEDDALYGPDYKFRGMVHALMTRGSSFINLLGHAKVRLISQSLIGHGCIIHAYNSSSMPPGASNYSRSIHVDSPRLVPGYITNIGMTIALTPFTANNGGMSIIPGSFRRTTSPTEMEFSAQALQPPLDAGDMIVFNSRCWHRGGENHTDRWRHSVTLNVCRAYMRQQFDYPKMLEQLGISDISDDIRQFLGYYVRMPISLAEFQLPAAQRPYRPGQE